jgi:transposase-like protein
MYGRIILHEDRIVVEVRGEVFVKYAAINSRGHTLPARLGVAVEGYNKRTLPVAKSCPKHLTLAGFFVLRLYILRQ